MKYNKPMALDKVLLGHINTHPGAHSPDAFGIEVELEGRNIIAPQGPIYDYWFTHADGSLRKIAPGSQCVEYVSNQPLSMKNVEKSIEILFSYLNNTPKVEVFDSYRTSIHVHVNYAVEKYITIYNAITLSIILDELFVSQNGDHRIGNNFCLRSGDALGQMVDLINSIQFRNDILGMPEDSRYSSINFASLRKFGSIEYRSMECSLHRGRVLHWVKTLQQLKESAREYENPTEIMRQFSALQPKEFLQKNLGPYSLKYEGVKGYEDMLHNGMRIAQDFAFCSEWRAKQ